MRENMTTEITDKLEPVKRLTKDLKEAALLMTNAEVRFLVDTYYMMQDDRKRFANQSRALLEQEEPNNLIPWLTGQADGLEQQIKRALDIWSADQAVGKWARSIVGIGPVISAGLLAHINIEKAPTVGHIWRYAGLDPTSKWEKGQKRQWNAELKTLCWKIGESFVKVSGKDDDVYGKVYLQRKEYENARNEQLLYKEIAEYRATTVDKKTEAYKSYIIGKLPAGHLHARCKRYAVKLFLAHFHHALYLKHYGTKPPKPWVIEHGGHIHFIEPPNLSMLTVK
jgi:hypothetical protein